MEMKELIRVLEKLEASDDCGKVFIPECWNYNGVAYEISDGRPGEQLVTMREWAAGCVKGIVESEECELPQTIAEMNIYSMLLRTFSSWTHHENGKVYSGTFLKTICLLPLLKDMGIRCVYLLPVFQTSDVYKKGELSSPYSIKNVMKANSSLHDELLDGMEPEEEFKALVEACHHLGMKVIVDFVFRTVSRDNDLLYDHPEYFYWIKKECEASFAAPAVDGIGHTVPSAGVNRLIYESDGIDEYLSQFVSPPSREDWERVKEYAAGNGKSLLEAAGELLSVVTMPGFADTINDVQPPWTDITFLKLYNSPSPFAAEVLDVSKYAPFIAQDGVKCSCFDDGEKNEPLWRYIEQVIPYYIDNCGIDGARIDMAHALPSELAERILKAVREKSSDFILWSEEFSTEGSRKAKNSGYDMMTGGVWDLWDKFGMHDFNSMLRECLNSCIPVIAATESADTPRVRIFLDDDETLNAQCLTFLLPNSVPVVNSGQEMGEIQPMNLGLKNTEQGRFVLDRDDPMYGKLAFFDEYMFHWTNYGVWSKMLRESLAVRRRFEDIFVHPELYTCRINGGVNITAIVYMGMKDGMAAVFNRCGEYLTEKLDKVLDNMEGWNITPRLLKDAALDGYKLRLEPDGFAVLELQKNELEDNMKKRSVAYFCMEFGLDNSFKIYSGGLGILAGDILKAAKDLDYPMVGVGILWRQGYNKQQIDGNGMPVDCFCEYRYDFLKDTGVEVSVKIRNRKVRAKVWLCDCFGNAPLYLLDTFIEGNNDSLISGQLYGWFEEERIAQEMILGIGGVKALRKLGIKPDIYHFNDSHPIFAGFELLKREMKEGKSFEKALKSVRKKVVFTTHTPVEAGNEKHDYSVLKYMHASNGFTGDQVKWLGGNPFNMTVAGLRMSRIANGVSKLHGKVARKMWSHVLHSAPIISITNGVHNGTWQIDGIYDLATENNRDEIWRIHTENKRRMLEYIEKKCGVRLNEEALTIGFARRAAPYKRGDMIFSNIQKLEKLFAEDKLNLIFSGKAHPNDMDGKEIISNVYKMAEKYPDHIVFLQNYDMEIGQLLTRSCDVWLNTPRRPQEACGTSGMKAAMNGVLNFSVLDGWWDEYCVHGINGWQIGGREVAENQDEADSESLYDTLLNEIVPTYYYDREKWIKMMVESIATSSVQFSASRMLRDYSRKMYNNENKK